MIYCTSLRQLIDFDKSINGNTFNSMEIKCNYEFSSICVTGNQSYIFNQIKGNKINFASNLIYYIKNDFILKLYDKLIKNYVKKNISKNFVFEVQFLDKKIFISEKNIKYFSFMESINNFICELHKYNNYLIVSNFGYIDNDFIDDTLKKTKHLKTFMNKIVKTGKALKLSYNIEKILMFFSLDLIIYEFNKMIKERFEKRKVEKRKDFLNDLDKPLFIPKEKENKTIESTSILKVNNEVVNVAPAPITSKNNEIVVYVPPKEVEKVVLKETSIEENEIIELTNSNLFKKELEIFEFELNKLNNNFEIYKFVKSSTLKTSNGYLQAKFEVIGNAYLRSLKQFNTKAV